MCDVELRVVGAVLRRPLRHAPRGALLELRSGGGGRRERCAGGLRRDGKFQEGGQARAEELAKVLGAGEEDLEERERVGAHLRAVECDWRAVSMRCVEASVLAQEVATDAPALKQAAMRHARRGAGQPCGLVFEL